MLVDDEARANFAALIRWLEEAEARHEDRQAGILVPDDIERATVVEIPPRTDEQSERPRARSCRRVGIPTKETIKRNWATRLVVMGKFDSLAEVNEADYCWACGFYDGGTERAHIKAHVLGGTNEAENIHLLCPYCHFESEMLDGEEYWRWFLAGGRLSRLFKAVTT